MKKNFSDIFILPLDSSWMKKNLGFEYQKEKKTNALIMKLNQHLES